MYTGKKDGGDLETRTTLLKRLKDLDDNTSWSRFFNSYWKLIYNCAIKAGLYHDEAEDVVQDTVLTVSKKIGDFKYNPELGSFKGWLLKTTRWRICDQFRKRKPDAYAERHCDGEWSESIEEMMPDNTDWEDAWERNWRENLVEVATEHVKGTVSPKQFQIFDLYVLKQWPAKKVAKIMQVSCAQVYLAKHRITRQIKKKIKHLEAGSV